MRYFLSLFLLLTLSSCDQKSAHGTKDRARAEEEAAKDVENENHARKVKAMELDLRKRYLFFRAVDSQYEGNFKIGKNEYRLKMTLSPTLRLSETDRTRTLEEVQDDINNLALNVQTTMWYIKDNSGIGGCVFERVKPDLVTGQIQLASNGCPNRFVLYLTTPETSSDSRGIKSGLLAKDILDGGQNSAEYLFAEVSSQFNPQGWNAIIKKIK